MDGLDLSQRVVLVGEQKGLKIPRLFTKAGENVYDTCEWEKRTSLIKNPDGSIVFQMDNVEVPKFWSQTATDILAQKYFRRKGVPQVDDKGNLILDENGNVVLGSEKSLKQVVHRLAGCWRWWGEKFNYFATPEDAQAFEDEMKFMLIHQIAAPNSPQWFNTGLNFAYGITHPGTGYWYVDPVTKEVIESQDDYIRPLAHACFIQTIKDDLTGPGGIMDLWVREAKIFKLGSGSGVNFSTLRAKGEPLSGGGVSSGVMSFLRIGDATAGSIKCIHSDMELVTKEGIKKIKDVVKGDYVLTRNGFKEVLNVFDNGYKELVKVKTSLGFEVVCTPEHRFLVRNAEGKETWKEAKDIGEEDFICINFSGYEYSEYQKLKRIELKHHNEKKIKLPEILDERLGEWLGLIFGDGSITEKSYSAYIGIQIGLEDGDMVDKYKKLSKEIFGVHVFENKRKDKRDNSISLRIASKPLIRFLKENDLLKERSNKLFIPKKIKESPASVRAAFLRGYFESDGAIVKHLYPSCSSTSERLIKDVQLLLQSIGILSTIFSSDNREGAFGSLPLYKLLVTSFFGIKEFATKVSFISDRKKQIMLKGLKSLDNREFEQQWILPYFENDFEKMYAGLSGRRYEIRRVTSKYFRETTGKTNFNRFRANKLINMFDQLKGTFVEALAKSNIYYDKITVEPFGRGHVFDLEVPDGNHYLVNGIVTHNSGGITRRAAKMVILNIDHPEIENFITWKVKEEKKLAALVEAGLVDATMEHADEAIYGYQSNNSVRVPDEFMKAVNEEKDWDLIGRKTGKPMKTVKTNYLWDLIAKSAWSCADPGMQYDTTINDWHTCPASGRINGSNPCSEYMFLDDTACNLASINLGKFLDEETKVFDSDSYKYVIRLWAIALEITVLMAQLPSKEIALNTYKFRTLGLGYTNLGSVLMKLGIPYDSEEARAFCAVITAIMTGESYATSAEMASLLGPFEEYEKNQEHMLRVIRNHRRIVYNAAAHEFEGLNTIPRGINHKYCPEYLLQAAIQSWDRALALGEKYGYRNAQATLIAPTGTISLIMDCDTTGIEPDFALVKFKKLAGGGYLKIVNQSVERSLKNLGYSEEQIRDILRYMLGTNKFEGAPYINTFMLKRKGFIDEDIAKLEKLLPSALDLSFIFNVNTLGKECLERLGFRESRYASPDFNLLKALGFRNDEIEAANEFICGTQTTEGAPHLKAEHYPVFDCANKCGKKGERYIDYMAHVYMMAAAQPLLSGSISKCVTGETIILTEKGLIPIKNFHNGEKPDSFNNLLIELGSIDKTQIADLFYYGGIHPTIRLTLADGRAIEGTPNHMIKVANKNYYGWKRLADVTQNDMVAVKIGSNIWSKEDFKIDFEPTEYYGCQKVIKLPSKMTEQLARFLGYYIAEGNITKSNWTIHITNNSEKILKFCLKIVKELFGIDGKILIDKRNGVKSFVVSSKALVELLNYLGCKDNSEEKEIPYSILQSTEKVIREFISGLWLDGYIRKDGMIAICLSSEKLLRQLQIIMDNFGIRSRLMKKYNKKYQKYYTELQIHGNYSKIFAQFYQLDEDHKLKRLKDVRDKRKMFDAVWSDVIPCYRDVIELTTKNNGGIYKWRTLFDKRTQFLSWENVKKIYQKYKIKELSEFIENNIHFQPIKEISMGYSEVYDFHVPSNNAFIGNSIINHNTINMPNSATVDDVKKVYHEAWKLALKSLALYRDGSKVVQPLSVFKKKKEEFKPIRRRLPDERNAVAHKFRVGNQEGYLHVGLFDDGSPGELFITMAKQGSTMAGLMDAFALTVSISLQYGVPLKVLVSKFINSRFEPMGWTDNPNIPVAKSIMDYIFRWMAFKFLPQEDLKNLGLLNGEQIVVTGEKPEEVESKVQDVAKLTLFTKETDSDLAGDVPTCYECGSMMVRSGSCYVCTSCGATNGCS